MSVQDLRDWSMPSSFLAEAEHDNYVNHNLEIARRTAADRRSSSAFSIEQNAIEAAIARHGLGVVANPSPAPIATTSGSTTSNSNSSTIKSPNLDEENEVMQPPPVRRQRIDGAAVGLGEGGGATSSAASSYQHFLALAYVYSESYQNSTNSTNNNNNNNNNDQDIDLNELAMKKTIDSLGLRRTY